MHTVSASLLQEAGHRQEPPVDRIGGEAKTLKGEDAEERLGVAIAKHGNRRLGAAINPDAATGSGLNR